MEELVGRQFGPYRVVGVLGQGGMASVYKAFQPAVNRYVAIKVLGHQYAADLQFVSRFRHEAKIIAQLQHPHILPIFDFGETDGYMYLAMALLQGGTLANRLAGSPLPLAFVDHVVAQVGGALDYAHAKGVVHRDIKPTNILIDEVGNCLLADFGIAYFAGDLTRLTLPGSLMGTPAYMSPEQAAGEDVGPRSDLYSLGIVLYEMLTGRVPFQADTPIALAVKHVTSPMPSPRTLDETITPAIEAVVMKALARSPSDRFGSGAALASALDEAIRSRLVPAPVVTAPSAAAGDDRALPVAAPSRPTSSFSYAIAGAIAAVALGAAAVTVGMRWPTKKPPVDAVAVARADPQRPVATPTPPPTAVERAPDTEPSRGREPVRAVRGEARGRGPETGATARGSVAAVNGRDRGSSAAALESLDVPSLEKVCDGGDTRGCNELGDRYRAGRGAARDEARAATFFQRSCDGGGPVGCDNLGLAYARGAGIAKDDGRAFALFQKSCDAGRGSGCWHLGTAYEAGRGAAKDDSRAVALYRRACDIGAPGACSDLGRAYTVGLGVPIDAARAVALFQRACDAGGLPGCVTLGIRYMTGQGVAKDEARAVPLFVKACDGDNPGGCFQAGRVYGQGLGGVARDQVRATSYFERACNNGSGPGCMTLAMRHRNGAPPFDKDEAQAVAFFERACDLRMADGCSSAAEAYRDGRGVVKNTVRAAEFTRRAQGLPGGDASPPDAATTAPAETKPATQDNDAGWMPPAQYVRAFNRRRARGFYPARVEGRVNNGSDEFRAEWKQSADACRWASFHRMPKQAFDENSARYASQGFALSSTSQFVDASGTPRYQGTWTKNCGPASSGRR